MVSAFEGRPGERRMPVTLQSIDPFDRRPFAGIDSHGILSLFTAGDSEVDWRTDAEFDLWASNLRDLSRFANTGDLSSRLSIALVRSS